MGREIDWGGMDWIDLAWDQWRALVNTEINFRVDKFLSSLATGDFS
jgi:hypothetical protein